ncbi:MAG: LysM peptidoglycan-binding domain-containing protein [Nitrospirae bacterium]|nr:LysM peptidoglycan-binding domain-containing protein [Nitrospirota bacterium]
MQEFKDYKVEKGDTLWDITREELKDPFLWPKVWKENPEISNPDKIYPDQKIKIPLHLLQQKVIEPKPVAKKPKPETEIEKPVEKIIVPVKKEYLVNKNILITSGYIADSVDYVGKITGSADDKSMLSKGDYAYIETKNPANKGDKFYIIRSVQKVKHPKSGNNLGYLIEILGVAEVLENNNCTKVRITESFSEITIGNLLDNFYEIETPLAEEVPRKPDINGYIVASKQSQLINSTWDIVYIDKGKKDGLGVGDLLATTLQNKCEIINGLIQVINTRDTTSTAIVRKVNREITTGDEVTAATQE